MPLLRGINEEFQSTPLSLAETLRSALFSCMVCISIHSTIASGDKGHVLEWAEVNYFNPLHYR